MYAKERSAEDLAREILEEFLRHFPNYQKLDRYTRERLLYDVFRKYVKDKEGSEYEFLDSHTMLRWDTARLLAENEILLTELEKRDLEKIRQIAPKYSTDQELLDRILEFAREKLRNLYYEEISFRRSLWEWKLKILHDYFREKEGIEDISLIYGKQFAEPRLEEFSRKLNRISEALSGSFPRVLMEVLQEKKEKLQVLEADFWRWVNSRHITTKSITRDLVNLFLTEQGYSLPHEMRNLLYQSLKLGYKKT